MKTKLEFGVKCMIDCFYWYKKESDPNFDYPYCGGWGNMTDEDIVEHWDELVQFLQYAPVVLVVFGDEFDKVINHSNNNGKQVRPFSNHNGVLTHRFTYRGKYQWLSSPSDKNAYEMYAAVFSPELRAEYASRNDVYRIMADFDNRKLTVTDMYCRDGQFNIMTKAITREIVYEYLKRDYIQEEPLPETGFVPDAFVSMEKFKSKLNPFEKAVEFMSGVV